LKKGREEINHLKSGSIIIPKFIYPDNTRIVEGNRIMIKKDQPPISIKIPKLDDLVTGEWYRLFVEIYSDSSLETKLGEHHQLILSRASLNNFDTLGLL